MRFTSERGWPAHGEAIARGAGEEREEWGRQVGMCGDDGLSICRVSLLVLYWSSTGPLLLALFFHTLRNGGAEDVSGLALPDAHCIAA